MKRATQSAIHLALALGKHALNAAVVVIAVVTLAFALMHVIPGDPAKMIAGPQAQPSDLARIRKDMRLDEPMHVRYVTFVSRLVHPSAETTTEKAHSTCTHLVSIPFTRFEVHADLGKSYSFRKPVIALLAERLPRTMALAIAGVILQFLFGITAGTFAALTPGGRADRALVALTSLGASIPTFLIGTALQFVFAHKLGWLPLDGFGTTFTEQAQALALPALTLGLYGTAYFARLVRDEMVIALRQDFVRTARAKGASSLRATVGHALRNALVPVATAASLELGVLAGGAAVTESVFRWPGLGQLGVQAVLNRDGPVVIGVVLVTSLAVAATSALAEGVTSLLDPRSR